jgi:uncharacterized membrane protein (UPF0127 family)
MTTVIIKNLSKQSSLIKANLADTFFLKLAGLMFKNEINPDSGLLLSDSFESRINTSIHMLFMKFDICVVWLNRQLHVVDIQYAKKWALAYFPKKPAQYTLELHSSQMDHFSVGDKLEFEYEK